MDEPKKRSGDPFAEDIVDDPRRVGYSVPGLNDSVLNRVLDEVVRLRRAERPRYNARSGKALVIGAPRAGAGKSHLIGRLFQELSGQATLVNVRPFEDPETSWKSILMRLVHELKFPDRLAAPEGAQNPATQLELFVHGVLSQIVAEQLEATGGNATTIAILRRPARELTQLKTHDKWKKTVAQWLNDGRAINQVEARLRHNGLILGVSILTWLKVLYGYAYLGDDWSLGQSCLDWIAGDPIDDEDAKALGIRPADRPRVEQTAGEANELAKSRVLDLCRLAGFYRPFLICFDQTETYGKTPELARSLGSAIRALADEGLNQMTLMTVNLDPWEKRLREHWEQAYIDGLRQPFLILENIDRAQGEELAKHRLTACAIDDETKRRFWGDRAWLDELFRNARQGMTVRDLLHDCSARWAAILGEEKPSAQLDLKGLFARYVDKIGAEPRRLVFDRDILFWLVAELAAGLEGLEIDRVKTRYSDNVPRWRHRDRTFVFGFEPGSHWRRWLSIARAAMSNGDHSSTRIIVCLRTEDMPVVPKPTWQSAPEIDRAKASRLLLLRVAKPQLVRLYAAQELYADVVQGDVDLEALIAADFLRQELQDFWKSILDWRPESVMSTPPLPTPEPRPLGESITAIVQEKKFLSIDDLIAHLPGRPSRGEVLGACGEIRQIRVHDAPNMTLLQWQSGH